MDNFLNNCSSKNQIPVTWPLPQVILYNLLVYWCRKETASRPTKGSAFQVGWGANPYESFRYRTILEKKSRCI